MKIFIGVAEDIGRRPHMEDAHAVYDVPERGFFSAEVYDGHGGKEAATIATEMLTPHFLHAWDLEKAYEEGRRRRRHEIIRDAYCTTDRYLLEKGIESGTTAATFYLFGDSFAASNAGDTRIVMGVNGGAKAVTIDHKAALEEEQRRIEDLGGQTITFDIPRVQGILSISRSLGDPYLKPYVACEPRVFEGLLGKENDFVVIACDGVWDVLAPDEVIELVRMTGDAQDGADAIAARALDEGSTDNITIIVLDLRQYIKARSRKKMETVCIIDTIDKDTIQP